MRFSDLIKLTARGTVRGKLRTFLTVCAIAIGVSSVVLVLSIGEGSRIAVGEELDKIGLSGIAVFPKEAAENAGIALTGEDAEWLKTRLEGVRTVMPLMIRYGSYSIRSWQGNSVLYGVSEEMPEILNVNLLYGRLFRRSDIMGRRSVAVVGSEFCKMVYGRENIVGKIVTLNVGQRALEFEIIGIIAPQASGLTSLVGDSLPEFIYVPYPALQELTGEKAVDQLLLKSEDAALGERAALHLSKRYDSPESFRYENIGGYRESLDGVMRLITLFIGSVAAISIVVSGIGIMNTQMSNAVERRREIGVYMALGAKNRDIVCCFLLESALLAAVGGVIGIGVSLFAVFAARNIAGAGFWIDPGHALFAEAVACVFGLIFGVVPARRAAGLDPVNALREDG